MTSPTGSAPEPSDAERVQASLDAITPMTPPTPPIPPPPSPPPPRPPAPPRGPRPGRVAPGPPAGPSQAEYLREIARAWAIVALACFAALAGCIAATGAMLVINDALTWEALVAAGAGLMWAGGALLAAGHATGLQRRARALHTPKPQPRIAGRAPLQVVEDESP